ncbi:hypothetical protein M3905_003446 [Vibrio metschnikovii]|nr:hypothetical protein [Vibrio metschnikovii]EKO3874789.1 hypothetical protein [Vibrio metschnikovii]EKO3899227.1 hypothetical protein [Vibrio metschnikovii]
MSTIIVLSVIIIFVIFFRIRVKNEVKKPDLVEQCKVVPRPGMSNIKYSGNMFNIKSVDPQMELTHEDFLGKAAQVGHEAKAAIKLNKFDEAWRLLHEQKSLYVQHVNQSGFTPNQALALDATVHEDMANLLRLEGRHKDALVDIVYWVLACSERPIKRHDQKLRSYFNRCKFQNVSFELAKEQMRKLDMPVSLIDAKAIVSHWVEMG